MHIIGIVLFGIVAMPIVASTVACIVIVFFRLILSFYGDTNFAFLWIGALIVGVPASVVGTLIFTPMATSFRNRPLRCILLCGLSGAVLGCVGFGILDASMSSVNLGAGGSRSRSADSVSYFFLSLAAITGCISGAIFGTVSYWFVSLRFDENAKSSNNAS